MTWPWILAFAVQWVFLLAVGLALLGVVRRLSEFLESAEARTRGSLIPSDFGGVQPGDLVADFELFTLDGSLVTSRQLLAEPIVLLFMEAGCEPCDDLARLMMVDDQWTDWPIVLVLDDVSIVAALEIPGSVRVLVQRERFVSQAFKNIAAPQAFAMRGHFVVGKEIPKTVADLKRLGGLVLEGGDVSTLSRTVL